MPVESQRGLIFKIFRLFWAMLSLAENTPLSASFAFLLPCGRSKPSNSYFLEFPTGHAPHGSLMFA